MISVKVFDNINDEALKSSWIRLQKENEIFPQMHYEWLLPWITLRFGNRKLHVITLVEAGTIIAIAPFCIQKRFGINVLESIPIHYGDKYEFVLGKQNENNTEVYHCIFDEISKSRKYSAVVINQVDKSSNLYRQLEGYGFKAKSLVTCPVSIFKNSTYDEFLSKLKSKVRSNFRSRLRKLNQLGELAFEVNNDSAFYKNNENEFRSMYEKRWKDIDADLPGDIFYQCRQQSFCNLLDKKIAYNIVLKLDDVIIGYRLGFLYKNTYCDWKICYDIEYRKYGLGAIMTAKLIERLIDDGIEALNHGAGGYSYKTDWTPSKSNTENFKFVKATNFHLGKALVNYELTYKEKLKKLLKR